MKMYEVIKYSQSRAPEVIRIGMTLSEAQKLCQDPDTSSMTARKPQGCDGNEKTILTWSKNQKHWFYGYRSYEA